MCFICNNNKQLGIFFKRHDYLYSKMQDLRIELKTQFFETELIHEAIEAFFLHQYKKFDALVGDCKCQVRVSMLLDILQKETLSTDDLKKIDQDMSELQESILVLIEKTEEHHVVDIKEIIKLIKNTYMYDFFEKNKLNYNLSHDLLFIVLCFFAYLKIDKIMNLSNNFLTKSKILNIVNFVKKVLSDLTIEYERRLAQTYSSKEVQKVLEVVEKKSVSSMTAFYPSFIPIWNKIKYKKQLILKKTIHICLCGGIKDITNELFRSNKNNQLEKIVVTDLKEAVFLIEGYHFNGSFEKLTEKIGLSLRNRLSDISDLKLCSCQKSLNIPVIENIEEGINAVFAQHPQFTNGAEIDWQGLGLENSELKKEYDYLKTLPGYSLDDMSKFLIVHIYASTVGQELEDQRQLLAKLGKK